MIADLPCGVGVGKVKIGGMEYFRVRLGKKFTGGEIQVKHFKELADARSYIFGDAQKETSCVPVVALKAEAGNSAFNLSAGQIAEAASAFKKLTGAKLAMTEAIAYAIKHLRPPGGSLTLQEATEKILKFKETDGASEKHLKGMKSIFKRVAEDLGKEKLASFKRENLEEWLSDQDDVSPSTKASYARHIHILFSEGIERGWCASNPATALQRNSKSDGDVTVWTCEQMKAFLRAIKTHEPALLVGVAIKAFAGLRTSELLRLEWEQVSDAKIQILSKNAKTRRTRGIPIQPCLAAWLKKKSGTGSVVGMSESGWHDAIQRACVAGEIIMPANVLRHSFGTYRYYGTKSENETAYEMGNSPAVILAHYRAAAVSDKDVAGWWKITPKTLNQKNRKTPPTM